MLHPPHTRLTLRIRAVKVNKQSARTPYVQIRIGHRILFTPKRAIEVPWDDAFDFDLSLHEHLFHTVQLDVYESRVLLPKLHYGRAEIRLYKLANRSIVSPTWYDLKSRYHCYANLQDLGVNEDCPANQILGSIMLEMKYQIVGRAKKSKDFRSVNIEGPYPAPAIRRSASLPSLLPSNMSDADEEQVDAGSTYSLAKTSIQSDSTNYSQTGDLQEVQSEIKATQEINSLLRKVTSWVFTTEDHSVLQNIMNGIAGFGQGIETGHFALTISFLLVTRFYRHQTMPFTNNIILNKNDLEVPRIVYRYAYAAHGWQALVFFGKRSGSLSDVLNSTGNYRAVTEYLQLEPQDMLICDLDQTKLFRPNFYIAIDRRLSAVILSIRGTMSIRDTLTDLSFEYVAWNGGIAHSGMLAAAQWFLDNIASQLIVFAQEYDLQQIIITGHSLGGATASLTTIMISEDLTRRNAWPQTRDGKPMKIHCYSYGTPAVLSANLTERYLDLIDSFIVGDDLVPRLSYGTLADLQTLIMYAAEVGRASDLLGNYNNASLFQKLEICRRVIQEGKKVLNPKLRIPGRVHHIQTIKAPGGKTYTVVDTCGPERFLEIAFRRNMLLDHLPSRYEQAFEEAYVTYLLHDIQEEQNGETDTSVLLQDKVQSVLDEARPDLTPDLTSCGVSSGNSTPELLRTNDAIEPSEISSKPVAK
ncbi:hypothetical protein PSACC_02113 [Paramicrosporidium saccamoebae]|uniref:sn-1-specific diacylglycerol lipase n=1 Tax=Paramicrosporidium saccamoebae TaxID=1246581 RepID=A0A2H9TKB6_9FUNG|nr:hypothetical protein PSACC_02113 [Paramicrosporidium saccamoebae]